MNRSFSSYLVCLYQNESSSNTSHMKVSAICMKMNMKAEHISKSIWMVSLEDSFWTRKWPISSLFSNKMQGLAADGAKLKDSRIL